MERRAIAVAGIVQGVGFRPFVYNLAIRLGLRGFVKNRVDGVWIEVEGDPQSLDSFLSELVRRPPPLARIEGVACEPREPLGDRSFGIEPSESAASGQVFVSPDVATCADCLSELLDPGNRRFRYPFLNCTNCGPRLTIVTGAPYDRVRTTMASFAMCPLCRAEYDDPSNRRFHAQPTCCPTCGPQLKIIDGQSPVSDPLVHFAAAMRAGRIGAIKGLGGYHLACDARSGKVVADLRRRKHRDEKPFALMVGELAVAAAFCEIEPAERELLLSGRRPIVLLRKRRDSPIADEVAPGNPYLGVMLPYTPIHHLLCRELDDVPLVMTSGNRSDEPIAYEDADALERLAGIADLFLVHDRPIRVRCDDSVTRCVDGIEQPIRRSRGDAPQPIAMPIEIPQPILAVGGQLKGTFALGQGRHVYLSHHLGDLENFEAFRAFERDIFLYEQLFEVRPGVVAHDLHSDYASTRYALSREGAALVAVQHHHAHLASCMAENELVEPVIGVIFDGTGYGTDRAVWGGEFLVGDYRQFVRAAHLRYVGLPGANQAIREPWRMALSHRMDAGLAPGSLGERMPRAAIRTVAAMLERRVNCPMTSSLGRLFDAVASLAGLRDRVSYEGQAAIELEWQATGVAPDGCYPFDLAEEDSMIEIDTRPLIRAAAADAERSAGPPRIARRFHSTVVEIIKNVCQRIRAATGYGSVVFSGGVFMNALLTREADFQLRNEGFRVYRHRLVPANDGGLSLGQLAVAAARTIESLHRHEAGSPCA